MKTSKNKKTPTASEMGKNSWKKRSKKPIKRDKKGRFA